MTKNGFTTWTVNILGVTVVVAVAMVGLAALVGYSNPLQMVGPAVLVVITTLLVSPAQRVPEAESDRQEVGK